MALVITTWLWGGKYDEGYVVKLANGIRRNLRQDYRFVCFTDYPRKFPEGIAQTTIPNHELCDIKGCFARLRLFDPEIQKRLSASRIVNIDLDAIVTGGGIDKIVDRPEPFVILGGANSSNPCPFNGSIWSLAAGYRPDVWADFSLDKARSVPFYEFPDDQAWFHHKMPDAATWKAGPDSGVYAIKKPGWPKGDGLPDDAKLVVFPGSRDPSKFINLPWVAKHWR